MCRYVLVILAALFSQIVYSQVSSCQPNIDFEQGNLNNWNFYIGSCCPISTPTSTSPVTNRHTLTSGATNDPYGGFPIVAPNGGNYSFRLGNDSTGAQAEKARYYVHVPAGVSNYDLIYRYAVVLQNPNHTSAEQPRFEIEVYDSVTNTQMPCNTFSYVASGSLPGFSQSSYGTSVYYKPWTTAVINLSGYAGHTMIIDVASGDCSLGAHFGYGYFDMTCGLFQISTVQCSLSGYTTLTAPPGFQSYVWKDSALSTTIATGQSVSIATPGVTTLYKVILTPYNGYGCPDTLSTRIIISNLAIDATNDTAICYNGSLQLHAGATGGIGTLTYSWTPAAGLSCSTCANPIASPTGATMYHVTVMDSSACSRSDSLTITFKPTPTLSSTLSPSAVCSNTPFAYSPASSTNGTSFTWSRAVVSGINNSAKLGTGNVHDTLINTTPNFVNVPYVYVLNALGCTDTQNVVLPVKPNPVLSSATGVAVCNNAFFSYIPASLTSGTTFSWSRAVASGIGNAAASGNGSIGEVLINTTANTMYTNYAYILVANSCSDSQNVFVVVKPTSVLTTTVNPAAVCSNTLFSYSPGSSISGTTYSWTRGNVAGIYNAPVNGAGSIGETLVDTTPNTIAVTYVYDLNANGCHDTQNVVVNVKPTPLLNSTFSPPAICNNTLFSYTPTSNLTATIFSWSRSVVSGISNLAATGSGSIGETLHNTTSSPENVIYTINMNANGCTNSQNISVTVYPTPVLTSTLSPAGICSNTLFNYIPQFNIATTTFQWARNSVIGISNPSSSGTGNIFEILVNTATANVNVPYTFVETAYGCHDTQVVTVQVKIYPLSPLSGSNNPVCQNDTLWLNASSISTGVQYYWNGPSGFYSNAQNPKITNVQLTNSGTYSVIISLNGCNDTTYVPVNVNPLLSAPSIGISVLPNDTVCGGTVLYFNTVISNASNAAFQWMKSGVNIAGETNSTYTTSNAINGDIITCRVSSASVCQPLNTTVSNSINLNVITLPPPQINITFYPVHYKQGDTVTFTGHVPQGSANLTYKWMKNGLFISGVNTSIFTSYDINTGDSICFVAYSSQICTVPDSSIACIEISTGIANVGRSHEIKIWPNPVKNELNIEGAEADCKLEIYNVIGQQVYSGYLNNQREQINTSRLIKGVYLLEINSLGGEKTIWKFVKE